MLGFLPVMAAAFASAGRPIGQSLTQATRRSSASTFAMQQMPGMPSFVSPSGELFTDQDVMAECLLLPYEPFPGMPPFDLVGEVQLQELEDDEETRTQLYLRPDGTILHGATDGPPPAGFCGLWQCGENTFQMTLSRAFSAPTAMLDPSQRGQLAGGIAYSVVRVYEGSVEPSSTGVAIVNGRIDLVSEADAAAWSGSGASSIAQLDPFSNIQVPPVGYFVIDANIDELPEEDYE